MRSFAIATALSASLFSLVDAALEMPVTIRSNCAYPITMWGVQTVTDGSGVSEGLTLDSNTVFKANISGEAGTSIKFTEGTATPGLGPSAKVVQLEVTVSSFANGMGWYDMSYINGKFDPPMDWTLTPSDSACPKVACTAANPTCEGSAYQFAADNTNTHACGLPSELEMVLCAAPSDPASGTAATATTTEVADEAAGKVANKVASAKSAAKTIEGFPAFIAKREINTRHVLEHAHNRLRRSRAARSISA